jgi:hypothetical protein
MSSAVVGDELLSAPDDGPSICSDCTTEPDASENSTRNDTVGDVTAPVPVVVMNATAVVPSVCHGVEPPAGRSSASKTQRAKKGRAGATPGAKWCMECAGGERGRLLRPGGGILALRVESERRNCPRDFSREANGRRAETKNKIRRRRLPPLPRTVVPPQ